MSGESGHYKDKGVFARLDRRFVKVNKVNKLSYWERHRNRATCTKVAGVYAKILYSRYWNGLLLSWKYGTRCSMNHDLEGKVKNNRGSKHVCN